MISSQLPLENQIYQHFGIFAIYRKTFSPVLREWQSAERVSFNTIQWREKAGEALEENFMFRREQKERAKELLEFFIKHGVGVNPDASHPPKYVTDQLARSGWDIHHKTNQVALLKALFKADRESWFLRPNYAARIADEVAFPDAMNPHWQLFAAWERFSHLRKKSAATYYEAPSAIVEPNLQASRELNEVLGRVSRKCVDRLEATQGLILLQEGFLPNVHRQMIEEADLQERPDVMVSAPQWKPVFALAASMRRKLLNTATVVSEQGLYPQWIWPRHAEESVFSAIAIQDSLTDM